MPTADGSHFMIYDSTRNSLPRTAMSESWGRPWWSRNHSYDHPPLFCTMLRGGRRHNYLSANKSYHNPHRHSILCGFMVRIKLLRSFSSGDEFFEGLLRTQGLTKHVDPVHPAKAGSFMLEDTPIMFIFQHFILMEDLLEICQKRSASLCNLIKKMLLDLSLSLCFLLSYMFRNHWYWR